MMRTITLPKQWKYWVKKAGLKFYGSGRGYWDKFYFTGRNRNWRVCSQETDPVLECSCPNEHFDRWANSYGSCVFIPKTEEAFMNSINFLIGGTKDMK